MPTREEQFQLIVDAYNEREKEAARNRLLDQKREAAARARPIYTVAYERWRHATQGHAAAELRIRDRLAIGLGEDDVLEVGVSLHHTYGTPLIRGSALKGLAAHYCDRVWGAKDAGWRAGRDNYRVLFGDTTSAGFIAFHDAWITPNSLSGPALVKDVMTPHHSGYYMSIGQTAPTDFDDPNPVTFLAISGMFRVVVESAVSGGDGQAWANRSLELVIEALRYWGVGAKTNSGYGRLDESGSSPARQA